MASILRYTYFILCISLLWGVLQPANAAVVTPSIVAGSNHNVVLLADGTVKDWGRNDKGQLGNGNTTDSSTPVTVIGLGSTVTAIASLASHTVALLADGTVQAWGDNSSGQLGNGNTTDSSTPVTVTGLGGPVTAIAVGASHTLALLADGTVKAWGNNSQGQLGNGTYMNSSTPVTVTGLGGPVMAIAVGASHTVALLADGTVKVWGSNSSRQLGNASLTSSNIPVTVTSLGGTVTAITARASHTVAFLADGTVKAWGFNPYGWQGNGTYIDSSTPLTVTGLGGTVAAIASGSYHFVVLLTDGTVKAWGENNYAQFGNGTTTNSRTPVTVTGLGGIVTAISVGALHTVALLADGTVKVWGDNMYGQLGNGSTKSNSSTPITVNVLSGTVTAIATKGNYTVARLLNGTVQAWGHNSYGQLGNGTTTSSNTPVTVTGLGGTVTAIAAGNYFTVALLADGTVQAWGYNGNGQLGNGTTTSSSTPVTVTGLGGTVMAIAAGYDYTVALLADGTVKAWGNNYYYGELGMDPNFVGSSTPVMVNGLGGTVMAIAAGKNHTVALLADGTVKAWGSNDYGQLGNGIRTMSSTPVAVTGLAGTVMAISGGEMHTVALLADGTVKAWGANTSGQLGDGTTTNSYTPVTVTGLGGTVTAIATGYSHSLALLADGTLNSWGDYFYGQLGSGTWGLTPQTVVINVDNVPPVVSIDHQGGSYVASVTVSLSCSDNFSGCTGIHYSVDGTLPTTASPLVSGLLTISDTVTLRYFAVDVAGNNSALTAQDFTITPSTYSLTINFAGTGGGTVAVLPKPPAIDCTGSCSQSIDNGAVVTLTPTPNASSLFSGWSGCSSVTGIQCSVTMNATKSISAFFNLPTGGDIRANGSTFGTISGGHGNLLDSGELSLKAGSFFESLNFNRLISFTLRGGYDSGFTAVSGISTIHGSIAITYGTVTFDNIVIQ